MFTGFGMAAANKPTFSFNKSGDDKPAFGASTGGFKFTTSTNQGGSALQTANKPPVFGNQSTTVSSADLLNIMGIMYMVHTNDFIL